MLQPKCRQPYVHSEQKMASEINENLISPKLPPRPPLPKTSQSSTTIDKDLAKQQQLSDWYYIKTGPKSPLPTPRNTNDKRNGIYNSVNHPSNRVVANISNNNNNSVEGIYGKNGNLSRESTKNNINVYTENMLKRGENGSARVGDDVQITKTNGNDDKDTMQNVYQAINVPSSCDNSQKMYTPLNHQYSGGEPLCKFNLRNNSEKVNGCSKWQQPQEIQQRTQMMAPPSPSVIMKKMHQQQQQQSYPYYCVEPSKKHLSSPRQDKHTKQSVDFSKNSPEPQCEQIQVASKSQSHNERLNTVAATVTMTKAAAPTSMATMTSNSNSNVHQLSAVYSPHQQIEHSPNANSSSFEHVNVASGFSSLSASSEMTIDDKRRFNSPNYADEQCFLTANNVVGDSRQCLQQQTVCSSPLPPSVASQAKVSVSKWKRNNNWNFLLLSNVGWPATWSGIDASLSNMERYSVKARWRSFERFSPFPHWNAYASTFAIALNFYDRRTNNLNHISMVYSQWRSLTRKIQH